MSRQASRLSIVTQENHTGSGSAHVLYGDVDDEPLFSSDVFGRRKSWSATVKQRGLFKSKTVTPTAPYNSSTFKLGPIQSTATAPRRQSVQPPLSAISYDPTPPFSSPLTTDDLPPTPVSLTGSMSSLHSLKKPSTCRSGNLEKLARTLGVTLAELGCPSALPVSPNFSSNGFETDHDNLPRSPGRKSLSLPSFVSIPSFFRSSSHNRHKSTPHLKVSRPPLPSQSIEDLHKFTFSNNLSNPHTTTGVGTDSPISPITFGLSQVPLSTRPQSDEMKRKRGVPKDQSRGVVSSAASPLTRVKSQRRTHSRSGSISSRESKPRLDVLSDEHVQLPEKANWLRAASPIAYPEQDPDEHGYLIRDSDPTKTWSGQWNQNDMQYVIRSLRTLK